MKKAIQNLMIYVLLFVFAVFAVGCQLTPNEAVVIGKYNTEQQVMQAAKEYKNEKNIDFEYAVPNHVTDRYPLSEGNIDMAIDADVYMPNLDCVPVAKIKSDSFTQKRADEILKYYMQDGVLVTPKVLTKSDYDKWIIEAKKGHLINGEYVFDEDCEQWLNDLLVQRGNAPDEDVMDVITDYSIFQENGLRGRIIINDEVIGSIRISDKQVSFSQNQAFISADQKQYDEMTGQEIELPQKDFDYTLEQAEKAAQKMLSDLGIEDMGVVYSEKVYFIKDYGQPYTIECGGYNLRFMRSFGGILPIFTEGFGIGANDNFDVSPPVDAEQIMMCVNEHGEITYFHWMNPIEIVDTMTKHVDILPFEDILDRLEESTKQKYSYLDDRKLNSLSLISVYEIKFGLNYLPLKNNPTEFMYAPCWDFVYKNWHEYTEEQIKEIEETERYFLRWDELSDDHLIFSAVDGASVSVYSMEELEQMMGTHMPAITPTKDDNDEK